MGGVDIDLDRTEELARRAAVIQLSGTALALESHMHPARVLAYVAEVRRLRALLSDAQRVCMTASMYTSSLEMSKKLEKEIESWTK